MLYALIQYIMLSFDIYQLNMILADESHTVTTVYTYYSFGY